MDFNKIDDIKANGFLGFKQTAELWTDSSSIPEIKGVYLVLTSPGNNPSFLKKGVGGFFKGKDPNVSIDILTKKWLSAVQVVYIGKATSLRKRLRQYLHFGQGKNVGHYGGRYIWQLSHYAELVFCWKPTLQENPGDIERQLLIEFCRQNNDCTPFANLK